MYLSALLHCLQAATFNLRRAEYNFLRNPKIFFPCEGEELAHAKLSSFLCTKVVKMGT